MCPADEAETYTDGRGHYKRVEGNMTYFVEGNEKDLIAMFTMLVI